MKKINFQKIGDVMFKAYLGLVGLWLAFALSTQVFFLYLQFTSQDERMRNIVNEIEWKIDGTFKDNPDNIWYEGDKK
jgi:hypothetical protein